MKARLVLQGANIPATEPAEKWMHTLFGFIFTAF
jgi:hypothetical protein